MTLEVLVVQKALVALMLQTVLVVPKAEVVHVASARGIGAVIGAQGVGVAIGALGVVVGALSALGVGTVGALRAFLALWAINLLGPTSQCRLEWSGEK